ncbi:BQ2448_3884 [Microbotryum intermedium]|uniref:BQ2448_3884 protein n=1 Tax=Microbotryum intermedium TaxID=269621 RepID=A0A238FGI2_9BASI|nr:BQ2448_3884 [Microbotryum intermedium]
MVKAIKDVQDERNHQSATVYGGLRAGGIGLGLGVVGSIALQRSGVKAYRSLTLPLKAFALTSVTTAAFIIGADSASREYELAKYSIGTDSDLAREAREGMRLEREAGIAGQENRSALTTRDALIEFGKNHRYGVVFGAWAASMVGSFGYISMTPLSFTQKLVQARMVAQGLTVAVLIASAGLSAIPSTASGESEDQVKRREREESMFRWKKGSQHDLEHSASLTK